MHTNLPVDTDDIELTIRTVQGIYIYRKDHTAKTTIFTPWSKSVIPFPSLSKKIKAFKEDTRGQITSPWMSSDPQILLSTPGKIPQAKLGLGGPTVTTILIQKKLISLTHRGLTQLKPIRSTL